MDKIEHHYNYLTSTIAEAAAAPLSSRKALLATLLLDGFVDRLAGDADVLAFRASLAATSPDLALVIDIAAQRLHLVIEAVAVPLDRVHTLSEADFMVSVYNDGTVQRVRVALPDGGRRDVHEVLAAALAALGPAVDRARAMPHP
ncbi:MAG: hypothetical protein ABIQ30_00180 [Devosia sp.]